ncbi:MAG: hypothetical protein JNL10_10120 [Verrucomicrobiales bacterium]|nr:hypothetical protein [Verrucomicrobiales bacterium]
MLLLLTSIGGFRAVGDPVADALKDPLKFVIEAEDYDFDGGKFRPNASVMPYFGGDYEGLAGIPGVDFSRAAVPDVPRQYRSGDSPVVPMFEQGTEARRDRGTWKVARNYALAYSESGQWFNYTRQIPLGGYQVWIAAASGDASPGGIRGRLQRVIGGGGISNPVVEDLGFVEAPGSGGWSTVALVPLQTPFGGPLILGGRGDIVTFRYLPEQGDVDFFLLQFVAFVDPPPFLEVELNLQGRPTLRIRPGLGRPKVLQGAVGLRGADTEWTDLPWDFIAPLQIPEDSPLRFFRLVLE